jgi:PAS domain S-box-containing protein
MMMPNETELLRRQIEDLKAENRRLRRKHEASRPANPETALRESEELLRVANEAARIGTYMANLETDRVYWSPELCDILGHPPGIERTHEEAYKVVHKGDLERVLAAGRRGSDPDGDGRFWSEHRVVRPDGQVRWLLWRGRTIFRETESGRIPSKRIGACIDITERKQVEDALEESENRYHQILEASPDAILVRTGETIIYANPAALKLLRASHGQDLVGKRYLDLVHPDDRAESARRVQRSLDGTWIAPPREHRLMTLDGRVIHVESTGMPVNYKGEVQHFGMFRDITDRKRAEEALHESEEIFNAFMEHCPVYVFFKDESIRSIRLSRNYEQMLGRPIKEILGKTMDELFPSDLAKRMIEDDLGVMRGGKPIKVVETFNGRTFETTKFPVQRPGRPSMLAGFTIDITERKLAEKEHEKLESQLRQAQKLEAIGTLAGGIAHDFNNILGVIIGNAEILELTNVSFSGKSELDQILSASKRAKQLVRQILAFSRQAEQQKLLMSLKPVVKETLAFLRASIPATIQLRHYIKPDSGTIMADPTQMQQVLMNLCTNAAHAMENNGGVLKIELDAITITEEAVRLDPEFECGEYVKLAVSDTGHGIEPALLARIFDPYFTTKGPDKGTGLGLAVVHGIVKSHGGIIKVYSEVNQGTVFHVLFPRADGPVKKEQEAAPQLPIGTERILVVDDETHLVEMYRRMLGLLGYQVEARTSPVEAIEAVRANPQKYALVLTDMTMPQMTGFSLAKQLIDIRSSLPIILCTGFSDQINEEKARSVGILAFLFKPVLLHDLAHSLRKVLDGSTPQKPGQMS